MGGALMPKKLADCTSGKAPSIMKGIHRFKRNMCSHPGFVEKVLFFYHCVQTIFHLKRTTSRLYFPNFSFDVPLKKVFKTHHSYFIMWLYRLYVVIVCRWKAASPLCCLLLALTLLRHDRVTGNNISRDCCIRATARLFFKRCFLKDLPH